MTTKVLELIIYFFGRLLAAIVVFSFVYYIYVTSLVEAQNPKFSAPSDGHYFLLNDGTEIFYKVSTTTSDKNIILVGGTAAWSGTWEQTFNILKKDYNVYSIDLPPFGYSIPVPSHKYDLNSQADIISEFIGQLNLDKVVLVAHSYGAGPATETVFDNQNKFSKLIIVDGVINLDKATATDSTLGSLVSIKPLRDMVTRFVLHLPYFLESRLKTFVFKQENINRYWVDQYSQPLFVRGTASKLSDWVNYFVFKDEKGTSSYSINYANFNVPTVLIWGEEDTLTPLSEAVTLQNVIPNNHLVVLKQVGHIPMIDDPAAFQTTLMDSIRE